MTETVTVYCRQPNGLVLRNFDVKKDAIGVPVGNWDGSEVTLHFGENKNIDAAFIKKWTENNKDSVLAKFVSFYEPA